MIGGDGFYLLSNTYFYGEVSIIPISKRFTTAGGGGEVEVGLIG